MTAVSLEDELGVRYLTTKDFLISGMIGTVCVLVVVGSVGWGLEGIIGQ